MTPMLLKLLLRCIITFLLILIAAVPVRIFIPSLGSLTTPLLLEWMVSPVWCSRELPILSDIFNLSLSTCRIPDAWKLFRVVPVFKSGDHQTASNYRLISLQPSAANFLKRSSMALSSNTSTPTISSPTDKLNSCPSHLPPMLWPLPSMNGMPPGRTQKYCHAFDLSKAFDRVPHRPLVHKLRAVGVAGPLLSWFRSYLACRTLLVAIRGVDSNPVPVLSRAPRALSWGLSSFLSMLMISVLPLFLLIAL